MYHLFGYGVNRASGGLDDYLDSFDTIEETKENAAKQELDRFQVVIQVDGSYINSARLIVIIEGEKRLGVIDWQAANERNPTS